MTFQTKNSVRSNNLRLKPSGCRDIGIRIFKFVAKTQFLYDSLAQPKEIGYKQADTQTREM